MTNEENVDTICKLRRVILVPPKMRPTLNKAGH